MRKENGIAPITIVILLALVLGGYFIYQKQNSTIPSQSPESITQSPPISNDKTENNENIQDETGSTNLQKINTISTAGWKDVSLDGVSFQIPIEARFQEGGYSDREDMGAKWGLIYFDGKDVIPTKVSVEKYNGGSRREQFLAPFGGNQEKIMQDCKLLFEEALFESVKALQIPHSDSSCPSGIIVVVGDKLVILHDLYYNSGTNQITRVTEIDTVISTLH